MRNTTKILLCSLGLIVSAASSAGTYNFTTDAYTNSSNYYGGGSNNGSHGDTSLLLTSGQAFTVDTNTNQYWDGAFSWDSNYGTLHTNASGTVDGSWNFHALDANGNDFEATVGTLVGDIGGVFKVIGAGAHSFTAWGTGELTLLYWDINNYDNAGSINSKVTTPEPSALMLLGLGMLSIGYMRKRKSSSV